MDQFKAQIVSRLIDTAGNILANQLSQPDWESRKSNIETYYKDLEPIRETLPDAPEATPEPTTPVPREDEKANEIVNQICTQDLSPKELVECRECVELVIKDPSVMDKYLISH